MICSANWFVRCACAIFLATVSPAFWPGVALAEPTASQGKALEQALSAMGANKFDLSYKLFLPLADAGLPEAQFWVGALHIYGSVQDSDPVAGVAWIEKAADSGFPKARLTMAQLHAFGHWGVSRDEDAARKHLRAASDGGDWAAAGMLRVLNMSFWRRMATKAEAKTYQDQVTPREHLYDSYDQCMAALIPWALNASQLVFLMVPLETADDRFLGALMGPLPDFARTGESFWECDGGRLRVWF